MLTSLRFNRFIRRDDEDHEIDPAYARQHVFDEPFMAGNVYNSDADVRIQVQVRESDVDRYASTLLFFQTIRFDAGKGANQSRLPMVNVSCCAGNYVSHHAAASSMPSRWSGSCGCHV